MKKQNLFALIVLALFFLLSCQEDKGDTEKLIGTWKIESYVWGEKQLLNESMYKSGIFVISPNYFKCGSYESKEYGWKEKSIFYRTNEKWINSYDSEADFIGQIRMENGSSVKLLIWDNQYVNGVYELQGNTLVIKGTQSSGRLHHIILTRYSY